MALLPQPLLDYLSTSLLAPRSPAYLGIDKDGRLADWGGSLDAYCLSRLERGKPVEEILVFLAGFFPLDPLPLVLSYMKIGNARSTNVHLVPGRTTDWILLLDASKEEHHQMLLQQKTNDLALLRQQQAALQLQASATPNRLYQTETAYQTGLSAASRATRYQASVLVVSVRGDGADSESQTPEAAFHTLQRHLHPLIQIITGAGGLIDSIQDARLLAVFGLSQSTSPPASQAVMAAFQMCEHARSQPAVLADGGSSSFTIGIGIASGPIAVGGLNQAHSPHAVVVGQPVQRAVQFECMTEPWEILIDETTLGTGKSHTHDFVPRSLTRGLSQSATPAFSCLAWKYI